ncbi:unnamed protein product [Schistosoma curassoni]|uniref:MFS transporter n=1 Tax=Schistosoma curassoni TaxID=6186 RepID=A0A183JRX8_9TREM|nr:unnamed protein product [Schistosoma curassoni]
MKKDGFVSLNLKKVTFVLGISSQLIQLVLIAHLKDS